MADFEHLKRLLSYDPESGLFHWKVSMGYGVSAIVAGTRAGYFNDQGYRLIGVHGKRYREHKLAYAFVYGVMPREVDHVDGERANNRIANLRPATHQQNLANCKNRKNNTSGKKGVTRHHDGRCRARIVVSRKGIHLGCFHSIDDAHTAYMNAARRYFGEFARAA